jgi:hypothetical protein
MCGRRCSPSLSDESADESAATMVGRLRALGSQESAGVLLAWLVREVATELPPAAVGHVKGIAEDDDGLWAASAPIPRGRNEVEPRRLATDGRLPKAEDPVLAWVAGGAATGRAPGEVRMEVVQVVVGCGAENLEVSLARAVDGMRTRLGIELVRE